MSTTNLFNVREGQSKSLREYLVRFNKAAINVINLKYDILIWAFQKLVKDKHFNEFLAKKTANSNVVEHGRVKCYVKCKDKNVERMAKYEKESNNGDLNPPINERTTSRKLFVIR